MRTKSYAHLFKYKYDFVIRIRRSTTILTKTFDASDLHHPIIKPLKIGEIVLLPCSSSSPVMIVKIGIFQVSSYWSVRTFSICQNC